MERTDKATLGEETLTSPELSKCQTCGEEIINEREHMQNDQPLCHACAGSAYYTPIR